MLCACSMVRDDEGLAPPPLPVISTSPYPLLKSRIDGWITSGLGPYTLASIKIVSLKDGSTLYELYPHVLMPPASVQKLFTAAAALARLGPHHVLETVVCVVPDRNEIYVRGCGDPLMESRDIECLARAVAGNLKPDTVYSIIGDTDCFDDKYWGNGWVRDDDPENEPVYISALSINGNTFTLLIDPGDAAQDPLHVSVSPATSYIGIENRGKTGQAGENCDIAIFREPGENTFSISGNPAPECPVMEKKLPVWKPELYFLTLFSERLGRAGIKTGPIGLGGIPPGAVPVASVKRSVGEIVEVVLKKSDNLGAENLLKHLSHKLTGGEGSAADGARLILEYLKANAISPDQIRISDGSGLSHYNLTNADAITDLLAAVYKDKAVYPAFVKALPVAGRDGTLASRMKDSAAEGKVRAKTGSLKGISTLAGYTETADGEPVAFAIIVQNFIGPAQQAREIQDRIAVILSAFSLGGRW